MPLPVSASARDLATHLLTRETSTPLGADTTGAADRVCHRVSDELSRWVGRDGCRALLGRALATAQASGAHPVLDTVRISAGSVYCLDGLTIAAVRFGTPAANDGAAAVLAALTDLLGRLVGDDVAHSLLRQAAQSPPAPASARRARGTP